MAQEIRDAAGHLIGYELEHTAQHVDDMCDRTEALEDTEEAVAGYSQSAQSNAQAAAQSAASAAADKTAAAQSASQAQASAAQAAADATATETAKTAAQTAKTAAEAARDRAEAAANTAEGAKTDALNAQAAAESAQTAAAASAASAETSATSAGTDATAAGTAKTAAEAAQAAAEAAAEDARQHSASVPSVNGKTGAVWLVPADLGLGNVDNTSDAAKKTAFTGSITSGNTGFATGGDVFSGLSGKADATALNDKLDKSGGTMSGALAMGSNRITGLADGVNDTDAVSKGQLDLAASRAANRYLELIDLGTFANGTEFQSWYTSSGLKADISSGQFQKALVGHKVTINGRRYYFAHTNLWLHTGDTECTTNHMVVVPAGNLSSGQMNSTNITTGAYIGSDMYTGNNGNTALADAKAIIRADFGAANILTHRELLTNAVSGDKASGWAWYDSDVDLMSESMVFGHWAWASAPGYETGIDKTQLKLFAERPDIITTRAAWWLRDVATSAYFALVYTDGYANRNTASSAYGVRPVFAIC